MKAIESRDPITGVPVERTEVPVYLPGTPSTEFVEFVELFVRSLLGR